MTDRATPPGTIVYLGLIAVTICGLLLVAAGWWRVGIAAAGAAFVVAAFSRLVVKENAAGLLRVRRRPFDVAWMMVLGGSLMLLAVIVPRGFV